MSTTARKRRNSNSLSDSPLPTPDAPIARKKSKRQKKEPFVFNPSEKKDCGICFEEVSIQGVLNCCNHSFCYDCIFKWSDMSNTCPLCKRRFQSIEQIDPEHYIGLTGKKKPKNKKIRIKKRDPNFDEDFSTSPYISENYLHQFLQPFFEECVSSLNPSSSLLEEFQDLPEIESLLSDYEPPVHRRPTEVIDLTGDDDPSFPPTSFRQGVRHPITNHETPILPPISQLPFNIYFPPPPLLPLGLPPRNHSAPTLSQPWVLN